MFAIRFQLIFLFLLSCLWKGVWADKIADRISLLANVDSFKLVGTTILLSSVSADLLNENTGAIPLLCDDDGNYWMFAATSITGTGKIFYIGHNTFYGMSRWTQSTGNAIMLDNIFNWFGAQDNFQIGRFGSSFNLDDLKTRLSATGITMDDLSNADLDVVDLKNYDVITINYAKTTLKKNKIVDYVNGGGKVFMAFNFWAWSDATTIQDSVENYVLEECFRISISKDSSTGWAWNGGTATAFSMTQTEMKDYLTGFSNEFIQPATPIVPTQLQKDTAQKFMKCIILVPAATLATWGTFTQIQADFEASPFRMSNSNIVTHTELTQLIYSVIETLSYVDTTALAHAADFPGAVTETTKETDFIYTAQKQRGGFFFTGLYAAAGDQITFEITENTQNVSVFAKISVTSDQLMSKIGQALPRFPSISSRNFRIRAGATDKLASAHGGLIFVSFNKPLTAAGSLKVKINGGYLAPYFRRGVTSVSDWAAIQGQGVPWGVIESYKQGFIVQTTTYFKSITDPTSVTVFWDQVFDDMTDFTGDVRTPIQWWHADRVISIGYMHSGNPIQVPTGENDNLIGGSPGGGNSSTIFTHPSWGFYHQIGHNYQSPLWTWGWATEVTVNIFSLRQTYNNFGIMPLSAPWIGTAAQVQQFYADWNKNPVFKDSDARALLYPYAEIIQNIGWRFMKTVFAYYRTMPDTEKPQTDDDQIRKWMEVTSKVAGYNLLPRFRYWKWPFVNEVEYLVDKYNDWNNDKNITDTWPGKEKVIVPIVYTETVFYPNNGPSWKKDTETCCELSESLFTVKAGWIVKINQDPSTAPGVVIIDIDSINIYGSIIFDDSLNDITIRTKSLYVASGGIFTLGSEPSRYSGQFKIELKGKQSDPSLASFEVGYPVGNKGIGVGGDFKLYGPNFPSTYTPLVENAKPSDTSILVLNATGWQVGDQIVIAPSGNVANQFDQQTITSITPSGSYFKIEMNETLKYFHHGDKVPTIKENLDDQVTQILDLRSIVGHLSRQIKIYGTPEDNWGGHIRVYFQGYIVLSGVQLNNMGQIDTKNAAIEFQEVYQSKYPAAEQSLIENSAIHDCFGICFRSYRSIGFRIENNVLFKAHPIMIDIYQSKNFTISSNAFISALDRPTYDSSKESYDVKTFIFMNFTNYTNYTQGFVRDVKEDLINITGNIGQGSDGLGYAFPTFNCQQKSFMIQGQTGIFDNQAIGAQIGVLIFPFIDSPQCAWAGRVSLGLNQKGFQYAANSTESLEIEYLISAENSIGLSLRQKSHDEISPKYTYFRKSSLYGVARLTCSDCFTQTLQTLDFCSGAWGLQTLATTIWTGNYSLLIDPILDVDVVSNHSSIYSKATLENVLFANFKENYESLKDCTKNFAIGTNPTASDYTPPHVLKNSSCINCDQNSQVWFSSPNDSWIGVQGGCGNSQCSGLSNVLITDLDSKFLGDPTSFQAVTTQAISANELFIQSMEGKCMVNPAWNSGAYCSSEQVAVLNFEDMDTAYGQVYDPIIIQDIDTGTIINQINSFREWDYQDGVPLELRKNKFGPLIKFKSQFKLQFPQQPPRQVLFTMKGSSENIWVIPSITYAEPLSLKIINRGQVKQPQPNIYFETSDPTKFDLRNMIECGSHNYFLQNNTVSFVMLGGNDCNLEIQQVSSIFLTAGIPLNIQEFLSDNKPVTFILRVCSFLNISSTQLRIVGFNTPKRRGLNRDLQASSEMNVLVDEPDQDNSTTPLTNEEQQKYLLEKANVLRQGVNSNTLDAGIPIMSLKMEIQMVPSNSTETYDPQNQDSSLQVEEVQNSAYITPSSDNGIGGGIIALIVIIVILFVAGITGVSFWFLKQRKSNQLAPEKLNYEGVKREENLSPKNQLASHNDFPLNQDDPKKPIIEIKN